MKVEEYIKEVEQLQIRYALREEPKQTTVRFLKGLNPVILERVELRPFWAFEDACKLAVKAKKQLKSRRTYTSTHSKPAIPARTFNSYKPDPIPKEDKHKRQGKELAKEASKGRRDVLSGMAIVTFK